MLNWLPAFGVAFALAAPVPKDPKKPESPSIVGKWECVKFEAAGRTTTNEELKEISLEFGADGKCKIRFGEDSESTYATDAAKVPAEIDFVSEKTRKAKGAIYKLEKDSLTLCLGDGNAARPTKFESPAGTRIMLMTFKRVPKKE